MRTLIQNHKKIKRMMGKMAALFKMIIWDLHLNNLNQRKQSLLTHYQMRSLSLRMISQEKCRTRIFIWNSTKTKLMKKRRKKCFKMASIPRNLKKKMGLHRNQSQRNLSRMRKVELTKLKQINLLKSLIKKKMFLSLINL